MPIKPINSSVSHGRCNDRFLFLNIINVLHARNRTACRMSNASFRKVIGIIRLFSTTEYMNYELMRIIMVHILKRCLRIVQYEKKYFRMK